MTVTAEMFADLILSSLFANKLHVYLHYLNQLTALKLLIPWFSSCLADYGI